MKRWTLTTGVLALFALLSLPLLALAQATGTIPDPGTDLTGFLTAFLNALRGGDWQVTTALALVALVFILRKYATKLPWGIGAFFATSGGGAVFVFLVTFIPGLAAGLFTHTFSGALVWTLFKTTIALAGGWTWGRRILALLAKIPGVGTPFAWVLALLGGDPDSQVQAAADAAKTATPSTMGGTSIAAGLDGK